VVQLVVQVVEAEQVVVQDQVLEEQVIHLQLVLLKEILEDKTKIILQDIQLVVAELVVQAKVFPLVVILKFQAEPEELEHIL
tara:strand:- start:32 stop:277 length:246 start_codon:yes stop_codon:yes gene_type:complete